MMNIEDIVEKSMEGTEAERRKVLKIMAKGLRDKIDECDVYERIYRELYGNTLQPDECEELIESLHQGEEHGEKWSLEATNGVASKLDIDFEEKPYTEQEFRAAMHIQYYECAIPMKKNGFSLEGTGWGRMGDFYFMSENAAKDKLVTCFFEKMKKK